jgi:uncharacterized protein (TIGR01777 family)
MATVLITGGTGLIGSAVTEKLLEKGYGVIILSRSARRSNQPNLRYAQWDLRKGNLEEWAIREADAIIHLAGAGVADKRWTKKRKQEIRDSRVNSGALLVKKLQEIPNTVRVFVSASAIGWYGPDPQIPNPNPFAEEQPAANDFLGSTCKVWEDSVKPAAEMGKRLVILRTGIVFSDKGGALKEFRRPVKFGIAPILGTGRQVMSWIHIDDLVRMYLFAMENSELNGIYNAVGPGPSSNREIILRIAHRLKGKWYIPIRVPSGLLKLILGEMSIEVLKSATVSSRKIEKAGFVFHYQTLPSAVE